MLNKDRKINLLIMPTDMCNMNCIYCFHSLYNENIDKMTLATLRRLYDITFKEYSDITVIWHGGEPLTMGIDFYKNAIEMQKEYNVNIKNRMQSNLVLMTDEFADFLCKNNIGIGTSFDGVNNEVLRGYSSKILDGRNKILNNGKNCGFIMVISSKNYDTLIDSYEYFKSLNANFSINPYISSKYKDNDLLKLNNDDTVKKLIEFFNYWLYDTSCNIHVNYFEEIIKFLLFNKKSICKYTSCLGRWAGIRYNGDIVPCNRYFPNEYSYGNIWEYDRFSDVFESDGFKNLLSKAILRRYKCQKCIAFEFCSGGCNNVAFNENGIENNGGDSCIIFVEIYKYVIDKIIEVMNDLDKNYNPIMISIINKKNNIKNINLKKNK